MTRRWLILALTIVVGGAAATACGSSTKKTGTKKVGIAVIAPVSILENNIAHFKTELAASGYPGNKVTYVSYNAEGQLSNVPSIVLGLIQQHPSLVYLVGTPLVEAFAQKQTKIPVVFGVMTDPVGAKVISSLTHPGGDLTGTTDQVPATVTISHILQVVPATKRIGIIGNPSEEDTVATVKALQAAAQARGIQVVDRPVDTSDAIASAVRSLGNVNALVVPNDNTVAPGFATVAHIAKRLRIPTFALGGGTLAGTGMTESFGVDYNQLGTEAGTQAAKILHGTPAGDLPVSGIYSGSTVQFGINLATARADGLTIPASIAHQATFVYRR